MDSPEVVANLAAIRAQELQASVQAIGYTAVHLLGYHDSGMPARRAMALLVSYASQDYFAAFQSTPGRATAYISDMICHISPMRSSSILYRSK